MKKILCLLAALLCVQIAHADPAANASASANIRINVSGAKADNTYFLCLPGVGCLSILAAQKGKVFQVFRPIHMSNIYVTNVDKGFRVSAEGLPTSCNVVVQPSQTITISGQIDPVGNSNTAIKQLRCSVSG